MLLCRHHAYHAFITTQLGCTQKIGRGPEDINKRCTSHHHHHHVQKDVQNDVQKELPQAMPRCHIFLLMLFFATFFSFSTTILAALRHVTAVAQQAGHRHAAACRVTITRHATPPFGHTNTHTYGEGRLLHMAAMLHIHTYAIHAAMPYSASLPPYRDVFHIRSWRDRLLPYYGMSSLLDVISGHTGHYHHHYRHRHYTWYIHIHIWLFSE